MYNEYSYLLNDAIRQSNALMENASSQAAVSSAVAGGVMGAIVSMFMAYAFIAVIILILTIIAYWRIFTKAGEKGWKSIIPIYNTVILFKIAGISPWWILGYLAAIIPVIGGFVALGITIYAMINLAKAFGKGAGFTVGLILLNTIFVMILGFGSAEYQLNKTQEAEIVEDKE